MQLQTHTWESALLSLAHEARHSETAVNQLHIDAATVDRAYDYCESLIAIHSKSFLLASSLLPVAKRRAARALYAFCRVTDDIVDRASGDSEDQLAQWHRRILVSHPPLDDLVAIAWADARLRYRVPVRYAEQLIEGVARDFTQTRYQTFEELAAYCYGVASTVGLMSMHIIGYAGAHAIPYIKLGVALQLTNILQDVVKNQGCWSALSAARRSRPIWPVRSRCCAGQGDRRVACLDALSNYTESSALCRSHAGHCPPGSGRPVCHCCRRRAVPRHSPRH
ncbi:MAG: squalene/phytoene synthase family protein [Caldilineaceae bacterium]